jgi:acyl-CoA dehydrogenase
MNAQSQSDNTPRSPFYGPEHEAFRRTIRRFVAKEIEPYATQWDEAGEFPRELYSKAGAIGYLGLGYPEEYGGVACDRFMTILAMQELARARKSRPSPSPSRAAAPMSPTSRPPPAARVIIMSSTAPRHSSLRGCAPTF